MFDHRGDVLGRHEQRPDATVPALCLQTRLHVRHSVLRTHKVADGGDERRRQRSAQRIEQDHLLLDAIEDDEPPVIVAGIDKDQRDA